MSSLLKKLVDLAVKANKWYIWLIVAFIIAGCIALTALTTSCQHVRIDTADNVDITTSADVSVSGSLDGNSF